MVGEMSTWHKSADPPLGQDIEALASTVSGQVITITSPDTVAAEVQQAVAAMQVKQTLLPALAAPAGTAVTTSAAGNGAESLHQGHQAAAVAERGCPGSKVVTLVIPHDISWTEAPAPAGGGDASLSSGSSRSSVQAPQHTRLADSPGACQFLRNCATALRGAKPGKAALILGGAALLSKGEQCGRLRYEQGLSVHESCTFFMRQLWG